MQIMNFKKITTNPLTIIGFMGLGVILGITSPEIAKELKFLGDIYIDLLRMVILPFLISGVIVSINNLARNPSASQYVKSIIISLITGMGVAGFLGLIYMAVVGPGSHMDQNSIEAFGRIVQADATGTESTISLLSPPAPTQQDNMLVKLLLRMIPSNIFTALSSGDTLRTLFFALVFGFALTKNPHHSVEGFLGGCDVVFRTCQKLTTWLLYILPIASFSLTADQIASTGFEPFKIMAQFIISFGIVTSILLVICIIIIWKKSKVSFPKALASQEGSFFLAIATRNSAACIPSMLTSMIEELGFDKDVTELIIPLGTALFRVGPVLYYCMATVFIAQLYGRDLTVADYGLVLISSLIAGLSSTGMNGIITISQTTIVCSLLGLPFEAAFVLFIAVEPICDVFRTVLLVISINTLVALITPRTNINI